VPACNGEYFLYGFKGAQARRNPGRQLGLDRRHAKLCWLNRGVVPASPGPRLTRGTVMRWAPRAALRPFGPRRRRRTPGPRHRPRR
jgi:hypothetical protein